MNWSAEPQLGASAAELGIGAPKLKGWYSRGYLPHYDAGQILQSISFRLADALPQDKLDQLAQEIASGSAQDSDWRRKIEQWLDHGQSSAVWQRPTVTGFS